MRTFAKAAANVQNRVSNISSDEFISLPEPSTSRHNKPRLLPLVLKISVMAKWTPSVVRYDTNSDVTSLKPNSKFSIVDLPDCSMPYIATRRH